MLEGFQKDEGVSTKLYARTQSHAKYTSIWPFLLVLSGSNNSQAAFTNAIKVLKFQ